MTGKKGMKGSGGARIGAGRHFKYGEETEIIRFVVPKSKIQIIKNIVKKKLDKWKTK